VIRVGFSPTSNMTVLTRLTEAFETRHPGSRAVLDVVSNFDPYSALRRGELDMLVNWLAVDEPDLTAGPVLEYRDRVLAVARADPLAARASVSLEDLADREVAQMTPPFPPALYDAILPPRAPSGREIRRGQPRLAPGSATWSAARSWAPTLPRPPGSSAITARRTSCCGPRRCRSRSCGRTSTCTT